MAEIDAATRSALNTINTWATRRFSKTAAYPTRAEMATHMAKLWPDFAPDRRDTVLDIYERTRLI